MPEDWSRVVREEKTFGTSGVPLYRQVDQIRSRADLAAFVGNLWADLKQNEADWENASLERYLSALARWIESMDGYFANQNIQPPDDSAWSLFGQMLYAASMYE